MRLAELLLWSLLASTAWAEEVPGAHALLQQYCWDCHGAERQKGGLDLHGLSDEELAGQAVLLGTLTQRVASGEMPPAKAPQPSATEREALLSWLRAHAPAAEPAPPDDPGRVVMPRLTPTQYERIVADLTGVRIPIASVLPHDGGAGEGFDNVGEAQAMTPTYVQAYLAAAKEVLQHARIVPGQPFEWSRAARTAELSTTRELFASLSDDWAKWFQSLHDRELNAHIQALRALVPKLGAWDRWRSRPHGMSEEWLVVYLHAAWQYRYRSELGHPDWSVRQVADAYQPQLHARIIERLLTQLGRHNDNGYWQGIADRWAALPAPPATDDDIRTRCLANLMEFAETTLEHTVDTPAQNDDREAFEPALAPGDREEEVYQRQKKGVRAFRFDVAKRGELWLVTSDAGDGGEEDVAIWEHGVLTRDGHESPWTEATITDEAGAPIVWGSHPAGPAAALPPDSVGVHAPAVLHVVFPSGTTAFRVEARADPVFAKNGSMNVAGLGRAPTERELHWIVFRALLGAPRSSRVKRHEDWTAAMFTVLRTGYCSGADFADWMPPEVLARWHPRLRDPAQTDEKWFEHFPYSVPLWYMNNAEDGFLARASPGDLKRRDQLADLLRGSVEARDLVIDFLAAHKIKVANPAAAMSFEPMGLAPDQLQEYQQLIGAARADEQRLLDCAHAHLREFTARAWRGDPPAAAIERLLPFYLQARASGLCYGAALKCALEPVLVSPRFLYRLQRGADSDRAYGLEGRDLAERLAFVVWGSIPDDELRKAAAEGRLADPDGLRGQIRRLIADPRGRALATEFAAQAYLFTGFDAFQGPDVQRFPQFTDEVRAAMYQECVSFFSGIFQEDRPLTEVVDADYVCVNETLARFYDIPGVGGPQFRRVPVDRAQRGGVLGMGAFLIANSAPLRSSPSKRGHWVLAQVLGTPPPPPPGNVPQISRDDRDEQGQTVVQQLARHRSDPACMNCHVRIDPLGVALESFDAIGRKRTQLAAKTPVVDTDTIEGVEIRGFAGIKQYLARDEQRRQVMRNLCRKFVGYALGRALQPSDDPLIDRLMVDLEAQGWRSSALVVGTLTSPQFTQRRDRVAARP